MSYPVSMDMSKDPYCPVIKKDGTKCLAFKAPPRETCAAHDPETIANRKPKSKVKWKMVRIGR